VVTYLLPQPAGTAGMELDRDDSRASFQQRQSESTDAGTQVDYQLARANGRASNDSLGPVRIQPVPTPRPPPGHDAP
jgi:hypothetical protein